jgi:hypothetical protein
LRYSTILVRQMWHNDLRASAVVYQPADRPAANGSVLELDTGQLLPAGRWVGVLPLDQDEPHSDDPPFNKYLLPKQKGSGFGPAAAKMRSF